MRKTIILFILGLGVVAVIAGIACSKSSEEPTAVPSGTQATPTPAKSQPQGTQTGGGTFRRLWADPPTLDPHLTGDTTSAGIVVEIFSGLVALDTTLNLVPDIAESWDISSDGKVYTFHLRRNAKFQNGKPVTANDFKWSLERSVAPSTESPLADTYLGDIVGVKDVISGKAKEIAGVKVIDDSTLQITIDAPKAYFLAKLTYPTAYVLDKDNVTSGGRRWTDKPNGTGAFKLDEYSIGSRIVLSRNDNYHREPAKLDKVVMNLAGGQSMAMYENNEIDITGVGLADLDRIRDPKSPLNKELVTAPPEFSISYIGFNTTMPPFDDVKFRQALTYAVNKELMAKEVFSNLLVPAYGILPPGFPGYNPNLQGLRFNADKAKQLLSESKYANASSRPRIIVTTPGTGGSPPLDLEVTQQLWQMTLGVNIEIQNVEWATFLQDLNRQRLQVFSGLGWEADYPDPQDFLDVLFHSKSNLNHGAYSNSQVDAILEQARTEQDIPKRIALYQKAEDMIVQDASIIPMWFSGEGYVLIKPSVKGYKLVPMTVPKLKDISIVR